MIVVMYAHELSKARYYAFAKKKKNQYFYVNSPDFQLLATNLSALENTI